MRNLFITFDQWTADYLYISGALQAFSQNLPSSLQILSLTFYQVKAITIFHEKTRDSWQKLDTTLSSSQYSKFQYIQILWDNQNDIQDELTEINYHNTFLSYFPHIYKNKNLLCGSISLNNLNVNSLSASTILTGKSLDFNSI